jgi:tRNA (guanine37-N1)-methyltransferase
MAWRASVLTLFPEMFPGPLAHSLAGRALQSGIWSLLAVNIRDFATDRHRTVDDTPFGGGAGMVLRADVVDAAVGSVADDRPLVFLTPHGRKLTQRDAQRFAAAPGIILLCGRYEGVDQRVADHLCDGELSIGDYVTAGGEVAALVVIETVTRLVPGVMGNAESADVESHVDGLLEYPHYTRPAEFRGWAVPETVRSGDHARVARWRRAQALRRTQARRPDLLADRDLSDADRAALEEFPEP